MTPKNNDTSPFEHAVYLACTTVGTVISGLWVALCFAALFPFALARTIKVLVKLVLAGKGYVIYLDDSGRHQYGPIANGMLDKMGIYNERWLPGMGAIIYTRYGWKQERQPDKN